jgi:hypothetical protein
MKNWKTVPSEPTREMRITMADALGLPFTNATSKKVQRAYHAALKIAPAPAKKPARPTGRLRAALVADQPAEAIDLFRKPDHPRRS